MGLQKTSFFKKRGGHQGGYGVEGDLSKTATGKKGRDSKMLFPTIMMGLIGYLGGGGKHIIRIEKSGAYDDPNPSPFGMCIHGGGYGPGSHPP
jgi:hypothetical protein